MNNFIIPCCGKSSRFPNMRPKWLLTHPDGNMIIYKVLQSLNLDLYDRVIIVINTEIDEKYSASIILKQIFKQYNLEKVEICVLNKQTKSQPETIFMTIKAMNIIGNLTIKDCDSVVIIEDENDYINKNFVSIVKIGELPGTNNDLLHKSYVELNKKNSIVTIKEKEIISNLFSIGLYSFQNHTDFILSYHEVNNRSCKEIYISDIIANLLTKGCDFKGVFASNYHDWGTLERWNEYKENFRTLFVDFDGVLVINSGRYGVNNWDNEPVVIIENIQKLKELCLLGNQVVITTSRTEKYRTIILDVLKQNDIVPHSIIFGCNHAKRVLINDFSNTNRYPSAEGISIPRNDFLSKYIK